MWAKWAVALEHTQTLEKLLIMSDAHTHSLPKAKILPPWKIFPCLR